MSRSRVRIPFPAPNLLTGADTGDAARRASGLFRTALAEQISRSWAVPRRAAKRQESAQEPEERPVPRA
jgi:hypothetical protein